MNKLTLTLIILITIPALYWFNIYTNDSRVVETKLKIPNNIDYYLKKSHQKSYKVDGSIDFTLVSEFLEHFKVEDESRLELPVIELFRKNQWHLQSLLGYFYHPEEIVTFNEDVHIYKKNSIKPFYIQTNQLLLNMKQDLVISESDVKVKSDSWNLKAKSMTLNLEKDIHFFTTVKAKYRNDKKA